MAFTTLCGKFYRNVLFMQEIFNHCNPTFNNHGHYISTLTGVAVGTVIATVSGTSWKHKSLIVFFGGLGGALPDFDAISLWSRFDATIGSF